MSWCSRVHALTKELNIFALTIVDCNCEHCHLVCDVLDLLMLVQVETNFGLFKAKKAKLITYQARLIP